MQTSVLTANNGGFQLLATQGRTRIFSRKADSIKTVQVNFKADQVAKKHSLVELDSNGLAVLSTGITESALVTFSTALTSGQTLIMAGLTWTAGSSGTTAAQLVAAWKDIASGAGYASLSARNGGGSFTAGTLTGYSTEYVDGTTVVFNSSSPLTNATDVAATGTGTAPTITIKTGTTAAKQVYGVLVYDVDSKTVSGNVKVSVYKEACFWADALVWAVDADADYILDEDNNQVACTAYNTGAFGTSETSNQLKQLLLQSSEIEIDFVRAGEL